MREYLDAHRPGVFDANAIRILVGAFDEAWKSLQDSGADATESTRAALAKYIIDAAMLGERDQRRLCDGALQHLAAAHKN